LRFDVLKKSTQVTNIQKIKVDLNNSNQDKRMKESPKATQMSRKILKRKLNKMDIKHNKHKGLKVDHFEPSS
jgi:uncharacterized protein YaaW (UPF0174 family)